MLIISTSFFFFPPFLKKYWPTDFSAPIRDLQVPDRNTRQASRSHRCPCRSGLRWSSVSVGDCNGERAQGQGRAVPFLTAQAGPPPPAQAEIGYPAGLRRRCLTGQGHSFSAESRTDRARRRGRWSGRAKAKGSSALGPGQTPHHLLLLLGPGLPTPRRGTPPPPAPSAPAPRAAPTSR